MPAIIERQEMESSVLNIIRVVGIIDYNLYDTESNNFKSRGQYRSKKRDVHPSFGRL